MGFFDLFKSQEEKAKLSHLKNLLTVALADKIMKEEEVAAIVAVMIREGIDRSELERCLRHPQDIKYVQPKTIAEKIKYLNDLVRLMMVDGRIDENEYAVCYAVARTYGFNTKIVDDMAEDIVKELEALDD